MAAPIPFNKLYFFGSETRYIVQAVCSGRTSGDGMFAERVYRYFEHEQGFQKVLLIIASCTYALEMAVLLLVIEPGDEAVMTSFKFVSATNAFVLRGAHIVLADSTALNPNLDASTLEDLVMPCMRAIVPVHYAGITCEITIILAVANRYGQAVVGDEVHAINRYHREQPLGTLGIFSFHETKNLILGDSGLLTINELRLGERVEIIWKTGLTRSAFYQLEVDKYGWVNVSSSLLLLSAAYLWAQIERLADIQDQRRAI